MAMREHSHDSALNVKDVGVGQKNIYMCDAKLSAQSRDAF